MEELIIEIKNGNKDLYSKVVSLMRCNLYKTAIVKLKNKELAEDAVQETFIQAYDKLDQLKEPKYFQTWITKILINKCNDINSVRKLEKDKIDKLKDTLIDELFGFNKAEEIKIEKKVLLEYLDEKEREIVNLYYDGGYTTSEISEYLDINENTVKSFLCRARKKLRIARSTYTKLSRFLIFIFAFIIVTSGVTFGCRLINSLKEKLIMFPIRSAKGIADAGDYIEKVNTEIVYNKDLGIAIDSVAMDDKLLYVSYLIDSKEDIKDIQLEDYTIKDEADNLLSVGIESDINNIYRLDYSSGGVSYSEKPVKQEDGKYTYSTIFQVVYNKDYPRSHKLYIDIGEISVLIGRDRKTINVHWEFEINLPDKFYKRTSEVYKFDGNDKIKSLKTSLKDLSFELEIEFNENLDSEVMTSNNIILENSKGEVINCYSKLIGKNKVKYICDISKHSADNEILSFYLKYNKGKDKYVDITLEK